MNSRLGDVHERMARRQDAWVTQVLQWVREGNTADWLVHVDIDELLHGSLAVLDSLPRTHENRVFCHRRRTLSSHVCTMQRPCTAIPVTAVVVAMPPCISDDAMTQRKPLLRVVRIATASPPHVSSSVSFRGVHINFPIKEDRRVPMFIGSPSRICASCILTCV